MCWRILLMLASLSYVFLAEDEMEKTVSCPEHQKAFGRSCYEFVGLQRSFFSAQAWCEQTGGHLAFISDEDTQYFLQRHLDPEKDVWFGVAPSASTNLQYSSAAEGPLSWLDGSHITYSNWISSPQPGAACGHILRDSGFQWVATKDCNKKMHFICQFDCGSSIVCAGQNTTLQCGSGQVVMIEGGFYGRKNTHYCRAPLSPPTTSTRHQCSWVDALESLTAHCHGRPICQVVEVLNSFGEPCPLLGSYLSVDYRCEDGFTLTVNTVAAVFTDVTLSVKRLLHLSWGYFSCKLSTGDGHVIYLDRPAGSESSVVHKYTHPSTFVVTLECTRDDMHITIDKIISIQEPVTEIGVIRCYTGNQLFYAAHCRSLYGEPFQIQVEVKTGTNVTYRIQSDKLLLSDLSVARGNVPYNISVTPEMVEQLGPGCHQLILYASNMVTFPEVSTDLQVCILEKVAGLQVSMLTKQNDCLDSSDIAFGVSLEQGAPVLLLFSLVGDNISFYETREMNSRKEIFHIAHQIQGTILVKVKAWNDFTSLEVDVDAFASCGKDPHVKLNTHSWLSFDKSPRKKHIRVIRSKTDIMAKPSDSVSTRAQTITLSISDPSSMNDKNKQYEWECTNPCKCQGTFPGLTYTITGSCLPDPFEFNKYHFNVKKKNNKIETTEDICITFTPTLDTPSWLRLTCTDGCDPVNENKDAKIKMDCAGNNQCSNILWNIKDPGDSKNWPEETKSCYEKAKKRPLIAKQNGGTEYSVDHKYLALAKSNGDDITVVITFGSDVPFYTTYTIKTSADSHPGTTTVTKNPDGLSCILSPLSGTVFDAFSISCKTEIPCPKCQYCFKIKDMKQRCSQKNEVKSIFLPVGDSRSNYNLLITATAKAGSFVVQSTITTQVKDQESSVDDLKASVDGAVAQLKKGGLLSGTTVGQLLTSVASKLNDQSDQSKKADRQKLREQMLDIMTDAVKDAPPSSPEEVQEIARTLTAIIQEGTELSSSAQEQASLFLANSSLFLLQMPLNKSEESMAELYDAANSIVEGASNLLDYSSDKITSSALLAALQNIQSALLTFKDANEGPTIIQQANIAVSVSRVNLGSLNTQPISIPNCSCPSFSLPALPSKLFPSEEPVDVRMLSLQKNPFSWSKSGNISGPVGALALTTQDGSSIPVANLSDDIEIFLPRPAGEQVNISVLDLGNFSTTVINVPSADSVLLLKLVPSKDPLPFKLFLGYMDYPTQTNYVAMTEMPQQGTTQEERYSWLLDPKTLNGNTGLHYLLVRPIVGPGIKSINATLSITSITAACKFWDESISDWRTYGCRVGLKTTPLVTQCLCNHLTFFGSSFFVTPNLVDPSRSAELFGTFTQNPVVVCFVGALFVAYFLAVVWARRKDNRDTAKVKVTVLEDNYPMDEYKYLLSVNTGLRRGASTSSQVTITLLGTDGNSEPHHLSDPKKRLFERGAVDMFLLTTRFSLGDLHSIRLWHNNSGSYPAWYVGSVTVQDLQINQKWHFLCNSWLAVDMDDFSLDKVFPVSTEADLKRFSNLFFTKATKDFSDGHLWYSVISRPPNSTFTSVQRVSCCFSLLLCTMLTSIMFYGIPTDPSEQVMELGNFQFTWQQFMIGVQSSLVMFPVNIFIVSIFRNTRPREMSSCKRKKLKPNIREQESSSQTCSTTTNMNANVTLDHIIKDITKIAHSLSETVKSNIPCKELEFGPGQQVDISAVLSVVEGFIRQNNKTSDHLHKPQSSHNIVQPQLPVDNGKGHPGPSVESIQKNSNKTQYLYRQLCTIDKELRLLGPSGFPSPHSYRQALQQLHGMKSLLEDQLITSSGVSQDNLSQKLSPEDSTDGDGSQKKRVCCHGGLPWWFIFVGWLLVIATSVVAGYFTMLYGLKFGKERSINWLVSMMVSFFQSTLIIQPLKVLCLAVFFALVIKKVDEEDFEGDIRDDTKLSCSTDQDRVRQGKNVYQPPPPTDIEKMKRNRMLEHKAFALLREIVIYVGFLWTMLTVAYTLRDPNAFYLNQHICASFSTGTSDSMSLGDVFTWSNTSLLSNLFGVCPGFITDGNSKLLGNARLRQLRVMKNSCQIGRHMLHLVPDCQAPYSWEVEDMGSYGSGWDQSVSDNSSTSCSSPWRYQTGDQLRAYPLWGRMALYRAGGFVAELGPDLQNASSTLDYLFSNKWLDQYTRALFVEFTVYNANVNLFCIVTFLLETTATGSFQFNTELHSVRLYQATDGLYIFVAAVQIIYLLFILYYMFLQGKLMKLQRSAYFMSKWNLLELAIIFLSWGAVAVFIKRTVLGNRDLTYYQNHKNYFPSFYETASTDSALQYLVAFLVLLTTVKLWHLLRINPNMYIITATLQRAWSDISNFLVVIVIILIAYSIANNLLYGWKLYSYKTLKDAVMTIISFQLGNFNYDEVLDSTPLLGGLLFGSCIIFMSFLVLNLLISVILVAFSQEKMHHKPSDEEEVVDLMLKKICSLFGIKYKDTEDSQGPDVNDSDGVALNNSKNSHNKSSK